MTQSARADEIQRDVEETRAEIGETLEEIEYRLSPGQLLDEGLQYFGGKRRIGARFGDVIRDNPLPVALIGVGLAWLAFGSRKRRAAPLRRPGRTAVGQWPAAAAPAAGDLIAVSRENLEPWLRDAHAMEHQAIEILEKQESRIEHYPELRARVRSHLEESRRQAERVEQCLHRLGTDTSSLKTAGGKAIGTAQQLSGLFASDEVLKSGIADYAFEHYEIACYRALIATASEAGEHEVQRTLEENLREEEAMAAWLAQHLPELTRQYEHRKEAGQTAKV